MLRELTTTEQAKYIKMPVRCPYCDSYKLDTGDLATEEPNMVYQPVKCLECNTEWTDVYTLTSIN